MVEKGIDPKRAPSLLMAQIAGCSVQHLRNMVREGVIEQSARGKYDLVETMARLRARDGGDATPMQEAKLAEILERTRKDRLANDEKEGRLVQYDDAFEFASEVVNQCVMTLEQTKKKLGAMVGLDLREQINEYIWQARTELAERLEAFGRNDGAGVDSEAATGMDN